MSGGYHDGPGFGGGFNSGNGYPPFNMGGPGGPGGPPTSPLDEEIQVCYFFMYFIKWFV